MSLPLVVSQATKVGLWTYESHTALWSCTPPHVCVMCVVCVSWARAVRQNKMLSLILLIPSVKLTNKRGVSTETAFCTLYNSGPRSPIKPKL